MSEKKERKLSEKEKNRTILIEKLIRQKRKEGYTRDDIVISIGNANAMAFILCIPICLIFGIPFLMYHPNLDLDFSIISVIVFLIALILSLGIHEWIHGFTWGMFVKDKKSIEYGFIKEALTPYCTCLEPLKKSQYILGSIMPGLVLGILPMFISLFTGWTLLFIYGAVMTTSAGGDFTIVGKLLTYKSKKKEFICIDHPSECGLIVLER